VIAINAPFARRDGQPLKFSTADRAEQIQLIKDLQRAVDVLRARPNVDDDRIAYVGFSYGGAMGALFVGIEHIAGTIGGKHGSIVLIHDGQYREGVAAAELRVASGTEELTKVAGTGKFRADPAGSMTLDLDGAW